MVHPGLTETVLSVTKLSVRNGDAMSRNKNSVTEWAVLKEAHEALRAAVRDVAEDDLRRSTPCAEWNVAQVLQHTAGDQLAYAALITGGPMPAQDPFAPSGELEGTPEDVVEGAMKASAAAWGTVGRNAQEVAVPIPPGTLTATLGVGACALDAAVHAWDLTRATGRQSPLTPDLAGDLLAVAEQLAEPLRGFAFAPALEPDDDDDDAAALLRYLGRSPYWTA